LGNSLKTGIRFYSSLLQRAITDFGADDSFEKATLKLREHYNLSFSASTVRRITYCHAQQIKNKHIQKTKIPEQGNDFIVCESDGSMIPLVSIKKGKGDARKRRDLSWKEAISTLSYSLGSKTPTYFAGFGRTKTGAVMLDTAIRTGLGSNSYIQILGDGAKWICNEAEQSFGTQGHYLIDFFHLCDYLAKAIKSSPIKNTQSYYGRVKSLCKKGKIDQVVRWLEPFKEAQKIKNDLAPVRAALRYINNRPGQFGYQTAREKGLPIGSGQIESTHRHLVQKRLKLSGAWWKYESAEKMLALRTQRTNQEWNQYWDQKQVA
jgi:hypothetical protein